MSFSARNIQLIDCEAGSARDFDVTISATTGALLVSDIQAASFMVKAQESDADADALLTKTIGSGLTLTGTSGDNVVGIVQLTTTDTATLTVGRTYFVKLTVDTTARGNETAATGRLAVRR